MSLLDDRLISPNGLEIARFFEGVDDVDDSLDASLDIDDDGLELAYSIWN